MPQIRHRNNIFKLGTATDCKGSLLTGILQKRWDSDSFLAIAKLDQRSDGKPSTPSYIHSRYYHTIRFLNILINSLWLLFKLNCSHDYLCSLPELFVLLEMARPYPISSRWVNPAAPQSGNSLPADRRSPHPNPLSAAGLLISTKTLPPIEEHDRECFQRFFVRHPINHCFVISHQACFMLLSPLPLLLARRLCFSAHASSCAVQHQSIHSDLWRAKYILRHTIDL